jgi:hypothetical protein
MRLLDQVASRPATRGGAIDNGVARLTSRTLRVRPANYLQMVASSSKYHYPWDTATSNDFFWYQARSNTYTAFNITGF